MLSRSVPLALYMQDAVGEIQGKMGYGVLRYSPNPVACIIDTKTAGGDVVALCQSPRACPIVATVEEAYALGARALVLGIAPPGGQIPNEWLPALDDAVARGMSLVNGLHQQLAPRYPNLKPDQMVWDVRVEPPGLDIGMGRARGLPGKRLLMIGTDMAIGKMTAGLEIVRAAKSRGVRAEFVATGQIGIVVSGRGVPLDAIRLDFASGAIEREVLAAGDADLIVVEGQGSLIHPASSANLPLLRGSCPTHLILCHRAGQKTLVRLPHVAIPPLMDYIRMYEDLASACGTYDRPKTVAVSLNTAHVRSDDEARGYCDAITKETGLPCTDPVRFGADALVDVVLSDAG